MKAKSLLAAMMAAALSFNFVSCSDDDDPVPGGGSGADGKTIIVNVEEPGTFQEEFENITSRYDGSSKLNTMVIKGELNGDDIYYLASASRRSHNFEYMVYLDISEIQIVESTYNGKQYPANHLYGSFNNYIVTKLPKNIEVIENTSFNRIVDVSNLFNEGLQEIGDNAFDGAEFENEVNINFPESLKKIGSRAFAGTKNLQSIVIPHSIELGDHAFASSYDLKHVELNGIEVISEGCFGSMQSDLDISMPNVKQIKDEAFRKTYQNYSGLIVINIKAEDLKDLEEIGVNAFRGVKKMIDLSQASKLTKIGEGAFLDIKDKVLYLPENVIDITDAFGKYGYTEGRRFSSIHFRSQLPPSIASRSDKYISCDTLYIPKGCKDNYLKGSTTYSNGETILSNYLRINSGVVIEE